MVKDYKIVLEKPPNGTYCPGSVVNGTLIVEVDEPKKYHTIQVSLFGASHVSWTETTGTGENATTETYTASEEYVQLKQTVWEREQADDHKLPTGYHKFEFEFHLQKGIPPSFKGPLEIGSVQYYVESKIVKGGQKPDKVRREDITVSQETDINAPRLMEPVETESEGTICCLWCASAPITMTANLSKTGFCVGEAVPVRVTLNNRSNRPISLQAELVERVTYRAQERTKTVQQVRCTAETETPVAAGDTTDWEPGANVLRIPQGWVTMNTPNGSINAVYSLKVTAALPWTIDMVDNIELTIGYASQ